MATRHDSLSNDPSNNWPVESQGSYDAHSRARRELWRPQQAPDGPGQTQPSSSRRSVDDEAYYPAAASGRPLMNLQNRSTPALQTGLLDTEDVPPLPAYDPSSLNFDRLNISDSPIQPPNQASPVQLPQFPQEPYQRSASAMSTGAAARLPRHAATMPVTWQPGPGYYDPGATQSTQSWDPQYYGSQGSGTDYGYPATDPSMYGQQAYDANSMYTYDSGSSYQQYGQYSQYPDYGANGQQDYQAGYQQYPASTSAPYFQQQYAAEYQDPGYGGGAGYDASAQRPPLDRTQQTISDMTSLKTKKFKAVDVSQPPYTREYIEQYRQRIKQDPDPESHFQYAKYLIDASKKVGGNAADQRAVRKYRETLLAEALKTIRRLATQGDAFAEAQFFLANCCGSGLLGIQVDRERAYHLYLQAAKQNHAAACYRVAVCNEAGVGTRKDPSRAFAFFRKAASLGDTTAMYRLGMILMNGSLEQQKNLRDAVAWLKRAAEQADEENPHALHQLGCLYESSTQHAVVPDEAYAKDLFTRAAQLGFVASQHKLGFSYEHGLLGCPVDPKRSIAWYTKAAEQGQPDSELALSGWYLTGSEGVLPQSDAEAYLWARRAANKGLSKAEFAVGYYAEVGIGVKADLEFAKRWYMRAAAQGNKRAMHRLTELKRGAGARGRPRPERPTRQQAKDADCVIC